MALNVDIKEIENLNISADAVNETDDNDTITTSQSEIQDLVKKQIEENTTEFCDMSAEQVVDMFDDFVDKGVDISKFDYRIYTKDFYAEKFPGLDPRFYECLEKASYEKFADLSAKKGWNNYTYENGEFVISFGGTPEEKKDDISITTEHGSDCELSTTTDGELRSND